MNIRVAVQTPAGQRHPATRRSGLVRPNSRDCAAMACGFVTLLAEEGRTLLQQIVINRAVRVVADRAILGDRLMVAHKRSALLHVARVAGFDNAIARQHLFAGTAVRIVAVGANDLAFLDRMVRRAVDLSALLFVARETHFRLRLLVANPVVLRVNLMAGRTGDVARGMKVGLPMDALAALMAVETRLIAFFNRSGSAVTGSTEVPVYQVVRRCRRDLTRKSVVRFRTRGLTGFADIFDVALALAVTTRTGRRALVGDGPVLRLADGQDRVGLRFIVAARANFVPGQREVLPFLVICPPRACAAEQDDAQQRGRHPPPYACQINSHLGFPLLLAAITAQYPDSL